MSGAGTPWSAYGAPVADIDRVEVIHHADGRREYIYAEPMEVARERLRLHREHAEAQERERLAQVEHDQRIQERVAAFIATSAPQLNPTARGRLAQHLARVKRAEGLAAASRLRLAEVSHAEVRRAEAQAAFDQLEVEVRRSTSRGCRTAARVCHRQAEAMNGPGCGRRWMMPLRWLIFAPAAQFECDIAVGVLTALETMTPKLHRDVLSRHRRSITARIRVLAGEMIAHMAPWVPSAW